MRVAVCIALPACVLIASYAAPLDARAQAVESATPSDARSTLSDALSTAEWNRVDEAVERALNWLALQQNPDGSFPTVISGQPAVTSLCVMAYLSAGHHPGAGVHGARMNRAIDFVLDCQLPTGLFCLQEPQPRHVHQGASHTATYNHAIAGLMLTEVYGQVDDNRSQRIARAIEQALRMTGRIQVEPAKVNAADEGGWRYLHRPGSFTPSDSDLSVTGWHLMFLRSAKNAEFDVSDAMINDAVKYVERCFVPDQGGFVYGLVGRDRRITRGTMGVGALSLALAGRHQTELARHVGDWLLKHPFTIYGQITHQEDRFHYSAYYCSNAMAQLGGKYWRGTFPPLANTLLRAQTDEGSWPPESGGGDQVFGHVYTTALSVLTLTPAYQLLPIYQR